LYEAARAQHLAEVVTPALAAGKIVVCERYTDATEAYQGFGRRLDLKKIRVLNSRLPPTGFGPTGPFCWTSRSGQGLSAARGLAKRLSAGTARAAAGGDRIERESAAFHDRVRRGYLALARRDKKRICVIAWGLSIDDVHGRILQELAPLLHSNNSSGPSPYPLPRGEGKSLFSFPSWGDRRRAPVTWGGRAADSKVPEGADEGLSSYMPNEIANRFFPEVLGQDEAVDTLTASLAAGRAPHAYLFTGPAGVGKKTTARAWAKALLCASPDRDG
jgi:thymidylate kinase